MRISDHVPAALTACLVLLLTLTQPSRAAQSATSFCKCVCAGNSTIIALNPPPSSQHSSLKFSRSVPAIPPKHLRRRDDDGEAENSAAEEEKKSQHHAPTCSDCNRAFCLDQGLVICKDVKEDEVFASCFQRDSLKDEIVVILFLACTGGLLGWALLKPWVERVWGGGSISMAGLALPTASRGGMQGEQNGGGGRPGVTRGGFDHHSDMAGNASSSSQWRARTSEDDAAILEDEDEPLRPS